MGLLDAVTARSQQTPSTMSEPQGCVFGSIQVSFNHQSDSCCLTRRRLQLTSKFTNIGTLKKTPKLEPGNMQTEAENGTDRRNSANCIIITCRNPPHPPGPQERAHMDCFSINPGILLPAIRCLSSATWLGLNFSSSWGHL